MTTTIISAVARCGRWRRSVMQRNYAGRSAEPSARGQGTARIMTRWRRQRHLREPLGLCEPSAIACKKPRGRGICEFSPAPNRAASGARFTLGSGGLSDCADRAGIAGRLRSQQEGGWCPKRGSNPHAFRGRRILSPLRLPIPPFGRARARTKATRPVGVNPDFSGAAARAPTRRLRSRARRTDSALRRLPHPRHRSACWWDR